MTRQDAVERSSQHGQSHMHTLPRPLDWRRRTTRNMQSLNLEVCGRESLRFAVSTAARAMRS